MLIITIIITNIALNVRPAAKHLLNARTCEYATVCSMLMIIGQ